MNKQDQIVFTPDNEPYLGRISVYHFDEVIISCLELNQEIANFTQENELNRIQKAATQIIPQSINLSLTIRELIRQGYLFGALVLLRPLIERVAIINYLNANQEKIVLWEEGWKNKNSPRFEEMLNTLTGKKDPKLVKTVIETLNHLVHGDPIGAEWNLIQTQKNGLGYSVGKVLNDPELCDYICFNASLYLVTTLGIMTSCFPEVIKIEKSKDTPS
ncbi:MAG: hypothetical protein ABSB80_08785 [Methanoregula sp.]|jgi:hypothetical protein|uniref:hypothetical protein n=1 Tax=Methanoregula sp. TaxID=2052170 RepID=UPI003D1523EE